MKQEILNKVAEIEQRATKCDVNNLLDENGNHPVWKWAYIHSKGLDEWVDVCDSAEAAISAYGSVVYTEKESKEITRSVAYIPCNDDNGIATPWFTDADNNVYGDCDSIDEKLLIDEV